MYAMADVVYGVPFNQKMWDVLEAEEIDSDVLESQGLGRFPYSGSAEMMPGYCGIVLDTFDEVGDYGHGLERSINLQDLNTTPSAEQVKEVEAKLAKLVAEVPALRPHLPTVSVYFVFYTS